MLQRKIRLNTVDDNALREGIIRLKRKYKTNTGSVIGGASYLTKYRLFSNFFAK